MLFNRQQHFSLRDRHALCSTATLMLLSLYRPWYIIDDLTMALGKWGVCSVGGVGHSPTPSLVVRDLPSCARGTLLQAAPRHLLAKKQKQARTRSNRTSLKRQEAARSNSNSQPRAKSNSHAQKEKEARHDATMRLAVVAYCPANLSSASTERSSSINGQWIP